MSDFALTLSQSVSSSNMSTQDHVEQPVIHFDITSNPPKKRKLSQECQDPEHVFEHQQPQMILSTLPPEVIRHVASKIFAPDDLLNFSLTCRTVYIASGDSLRHAEELSSRYGSCIINCALAPEYTEPDPEFTTSVKAAPTTAHTGDNASTSTAIGSATTLAPPTHRNTPTNFFRSPITLLHTISHNPRVAFFIREIHFMTTDHGVPLDPALESELASTDLNGFLTAAAEWIGHTRDDRNMWAADIEGGNHGTALALLLGFCPNLNRLHLAGLLHTYSCWMDMLVRGVSRMEQKTELSKNMAAFTKFTNTSNEEAAQPQLPLSKLHTLHIEHLEDTGGENLHSVIPLTMLPAIRTLSCYMVAGYDIFAPPATSSIHKSRNTTFSTLREVELNCCSISPQQLARFLRPMRDLQFLRYEHGGEIVAGPEDVEMEGFTGELVKELGDCVRERGWNVELTDDDEIEIKVKGYVSKF